MIAHDPNATPNAAFPNLSPTNHCAIGAPGTGFEKIAVYATPTEYTHAAKLLPTGKWSSKLGEDVLIEHDTPEDVAGGAYGTIFQFMKRPLTA